MARVLVTFSMDNDIVKKFHRKVPKGHRKRSHIVEQMILRYTDGRIRID